MAEHANVSPEMQAKVSGVLCSLRECIAKFRITILMPQIINQWKPVSRLLADTEYENCTQLLRELAVDLKRCPQKTAGSCEPYSFCSQNLIRVIDAFQQHPELLAIIEDFLFGTTDGDGDADGFSSALQTILDLARQRMYKDARAELTLEKHLHMFYNENKFIKNDIQKCQQKILRSKNSLRWRIAAKEGIVAQIEKELEDERMNRAMLFQYEHKEVSEKMRNAQIEYQHRQKELNEDIEKSAESRIKSYRYNERNEQEARAERNKLLIQLQTLTKRYDTVLAEKFKLNMTLDKQFAELQLEFNEFVRNIYEKAEQSYQEIVLALELKRQRELQRKLALFVSNRAARIIQRAWKRYMKIVRAERGESAPKAAKGKKKK